MKPYRHPCLDCGERMVSRTRTERIPPKGWRLHVSGGRCNRCYQRRMREQDVALVGGAWVPGPRGVRVWRAA